MNKKTEFRIITIAILSLSAIVIIMDMGGFASILTGGIVGYIFIRHGRELWNGKIKEQDNTQ